MITEAELEMEEALRIQLAIKDREYEARMAVSALAYEEWAWENPAMAQWHEEQRLQAMIDEYEDREWGMLVHLSDALDHYEWERPQIGRAA